MARTTVIVGAGSGGSALAARLTEDPEEHVILLEAGPDYPELAEVPEDLLDSREMSVDKHDWGLHAYFFEPPETRQPQPYPRGRVVGGSSSVNAAIAQRATPEDLRTWVDGGAEGWSYSDVMPYFRRMERELDFPSAPGHGGQGPVPIRRHARQDWAAAVRSFEQACLQRGFPSCQDANAEGTTSGVGAVPRNLFGDEEYRAGTMLTYLALARTRPNLRLIPNATCRRVVFEGNRAVGVEYESGGTVQTVTADRTVLAAGAVGTPQLLVLSGVGPQWTLGNLGITPVVVNEAVGRNLQDHPFSPVLALLKDSTDKLGVRAQLKFSANGSGLTNDMMMFSTIVDPATLNLAVETNGRSALTLVSLLARPRSTGWIDIVSPNVHVQPELHVNFLSEPSDVQRLMESTRLAWDIATSSPVAEQIEEILLPDAETVADDTRLAEYIHAAGSTSYHTSCTCRIGAPGDENAVVDPKLAVQGTENLWLADASVMVNVTTGLTNPTAFMIGERLADWLGDPSARTADTDASTMEMTP